MDAIRTPADPWGVLRLELDRRALAVLLLGLAAVAAALFGAGMLVGIHAAGTGPASRAAALPGTRARPPVALPARPAEAALDPGGPPILATTGAGEPAWEPPDLTPDRTPPLRRPRPRLLPARFDPRVLISAAAGPERAALRYRPGQGAPETPFGRAIFRTARRHEVNPSLVAAVIWVESGFDPEARSPKGARGLMQVMPATGRRFGVEPERLWEPEANLAAGVRYLDWLGRRFDDRTADVLAAYNAGEGAVDRHGGLPPFAETRDYVARVLAALGAGGSEEAR